MSERLQIAYALIAILVAFATYAAYRWRQHTKAERRRMSGRA